MSKAKFKKMSEATQEDWAIALRYESMCISKLPLRILNAVKNLEQLEIYAGYPVSIYEHSLQCATRALRDGADDQMIVACLVHDIGYELATRNHSEFAAAILRPYVREEITWIIEHHSIFNTYYYADQTPQWKDLKNSRDEFKDHKWFNSTLYFCENYDGLSFDPDYDTLPLSTFEPLVHDVFRRLTFGGF